MLLRHKKYNISYDKIDPNSLKNLNDTQAESLAEHFSDQRRRLAESQYLLFCCENKIALPEDLGAYHRSIDEYEECE